MKILIAEDDPTAALILRRTLEKIGHEAVVARDGLEAWERFQQDPFPVVISDWGMPGMDGPQLCQRIREERRVPYTYFILLTSRAERQDRLEGLLRGADDFLAKPLGRGELFARLEIAQRILAMQSDLQAQSAQTTALNARLEEQNQELSQTVYWLEFANHRYRELFAGLPAACYSYDDGGRIFEWNRAAEEMFGWAAEEACQRPLWQVFAEDEPGRQDENIRKRRETISRVLAGEALLGEEVQIRRRDGTPLTLLSNTLPVRAADGRITGIISASLDFTERRRLEEQVNDQLQRMTALNADKSRQTDELAEANARLAELATTDGLTGLKNHRFLQEALQTSHSFARRHGLPLSVLMLDVDRFKGYNDAFGHPAGDEVLRGIAGLLESSVRDHDIVARYGGEEFVVLLPATPAAEAVLVAERLRATIEAHPWPRRAITASIGLATLDPAASSAPSHAALLDGADRALYGSKLHGRNRVTFIGNLCVASQPLSRRAA